jgi:hypothetical protein
MPATSCEEAGDLLCEASYDLREAGHKLFVKSALTSTFLLCFDP